ncbi:hypothetical protein CICLE_v10027608mg [Citrus x clementina]|uniref:Uncharacterized protein n=1 Tax=Citrus clementina TaxID=85681 RepID=V4UM24_CITCL|nr:hypothetical protein CICLE_v10027608mg [Citrus x clementina]
MLTLSPSSPTLAGSLVLLFPSFRSLLFSFTRSLPLLVSSSRSLLLQIYSLVTGRRWSLLAVLGGAARLSPSTMFSPAANLQSLSPCKF